MEGCKGGGVELGDGSCKVMSGGGGGELGGGSRLVGDGAVSTGGVGTGGFGRSGVESVEVAGYSEGL